MDRRVAIVGAGPGGIVAAKFLRDQGLVPVIFEQSDRAGGQWHVGNPMSGVWPGMPTNTSRVMTHFSDLDYPSDTPPFPDAERVLRYLDDYIAAFDLGGSLRLCTTVVRIERGASGGWTVVHRGPDGHTVQESFGRVVIATGRFNAPHVPPVPGVSGGACHSHQYRGATPFAGLKVLVAGGAISAHEISADLAMGGAGSVLSSYRGQRYVLGKLWDGVPTDHISYSLYEALAAERLAPADNAARVKAFVLASSGTPEAYGARAPVDDLRAAGVTKSEHYLPMVAAGRISVRSWIDRVEGRRVHFGDGSEEEIDELIFATGYRLSLPFLDDESRRALALDGEHIALCRHTFHPDLPGLAFLGFYNMAGPYFPVLELQARWIAYVFGERIAPLSEAEMRAEIEGYFRRWDQPQRHVMHQLALLFGRAIGAAPEDFTRPGLERALLFGPLSATVFRLAGPDPLPDAEEIVRREAAAYGLITSESFNTEELDRLDLLGIKPNA